MVFYDYWYKRALELSGRFDAPKEGVVMVDPQLYNEWHDHMRSQGIEKVYGDPLYFNNQCYIQSK